LLAQPVDDIVGTSAECLGIECGSLDVFGNPVEVGSSRWEVFGGASLAAIAGVPERLGHVCGRAEAFEEYLLVLAEWFRLN